MIDDGTIGAGSLAHRLRLHAARAREEIDADAKIGKTVDGRMCVRLSARAMVLSEYAESLETLAHNLDAIGMGALKQ